MKELHTRSRSDNPSLLPTRSGLPDPMTEPVISAEEAFTLLGIDRGTGYRAIKEGTFPCPVLHVGRLIRVPTAPLLRALQGELPTTPPPPEREG